MYSYARRQRLDWFTIFDEDGESLGMVLARNPDDAIDMYLDDNPDCPDTGYLTAMVAND